MDELISIVLPTYNGSKYLAKSIDSILHQTYKNWELIIVNDGSTDNTESIINTYVKIDSRIKHIKHHVNIKLPTALNSGFSISKGNYLTWTSDDNLYKPTALEDMLHYLKSNNQIDLVYCDYSNINENEEELEKIHVNNIDKIILYCVIGPCFLYKRIIYDTIGDYSNNFFMIEDYEYWLRASLKFNLSPFHKNLYSYRLSSSSLTANNLEKRIDLQEKLILKYIDIVNISSNYDKSKSCMILIDNERKRANPKIRWDLIKLSFRYSKKYCLKSLFKAIFSAKIRK